MAFLPWENLFYGISGKTKALNALWDSYEDKRDKIALNSDILAKHVDRIQTISTFNNALLLNISLGNLSDVEFRNFLIKYSAIKPKIENDATAIALATILKFTSVVSLIPALFNFAKFINLNFFTNGISAATTSATSQTTNVIASVTSEGLVAAEDAGAFEMAALASTDTTLNIAAASAAITAGDAATANTALSTAADTAEAGLSETAKVGLTAAGNFGLFALAIGLDLIVGWVNGSKTSKQLSEATTELQKAIDSVDVYLTKVIDEINDAEKAIEKALNNFIGLINFMNTIIPANFAYNYSVINLKDSDFSNWQITFEAATQRYLVIVKLKNSFIDFFETWSLDNPTQVFSKTEFDIWKQYVTNKRPASFSSQKLLFEDLITYVADRSEEMSKYAK